MYCVLWNIQYELNGVTGITQQEVLDLYERIQRHPVGAEDPPFTDVKCYEPQNTVQVSPVVTAAPAAAPRRLRSTTTATTSVQSTTAAGAAAAAVTDTSLVNQVQYKPKPFLDRLRFHQKRVYIALSVNLGYYST